MNNSNKKGILKFLIIIFICILLFIMSISFYLSIKAKNIVEKINLNEGIWSDKLAQELDYCISEDIAYRVNYRTRNFRYNADKWNSYDEWRNSWEEEYNECGNFYTILIFNKAIVNYTYSQEAVSSVDGSSLGGAKDVECQLVFELKNWKWTVVDFTEAP